MNKYIIAILTAVFLAFGMSSQAAMKQPVKKSGRALEGTIQTRIGELRFESGYPSDAPVKKLYNAMDFQQAYGPGHLPGVG